MLIKEQTFSLSELITAVELLCDQQVLQQAHTDTRVEVPKHLEKAITTSYCPGCILHAHRQICYVCGTHTYTSTLATTVLARDNADSASCAVLTSNSADTISPHQIH
ncbi:hypothetical protein BDR03DRAFT_1019541 [Suillus americanus]|nr:hypothetical protein BDR03DRAFT_1019541 [Suillus americanus]